MSQEVWILSASRTPIGSFMGDLSSVPATELGATAIRSALERSKVDAADVDEVYMGCVLTAAIGQAPARQAALKAGLPNKVPCTTVGKVCGSGLKSVVLASQAIRSGDAKVVVAGGMENMSQAPFAVEGARQGFKLGHQKMTDTMIKDGLWDVYNDFHMGNAAELCASEKKISRQAQDEYATLSYKRAQNAAEKGFFKDEICPVEVKSRKGTSSIAEDGDVFKAKFEKFSELRPAFTKDGTVTAANASNINDGAAALVIADAEWAKAKGLKPLAKICANAQAAREPEWFTMAPADAMAKCLEKADWSSGEVDLFEINEAFSVMALAVSEEMKLDREKINVNGGAVALGHPIGASGARILVTLLYAMERLEKKKGMASLCIGGGEGLALAVERF